MSIRQGRYISEEAETGATNMNKYQLVSNMTDNAEETSTIKYPSSKALSDGLATKQNTLTAGEGITIEGDTISATGGSSGGGAPIITTFKSPSWTLDETNTQLTTGLTLGTFLVLKNGNLLEVGSGNDYTVSSGVITFATALETTDKITIINWQSQLKI